MSKPQLFRPANGTHVLALIYNLHSKTNERTNVKTMFLRTIGSLLITLTFVNNMSAGILNFVCGSVELVLDW